MERVEVFSGRGEIIQSSLSKVARISYVPQKDAVNTSLPVTVKDMVTFGALPKKVTKDELNKIFSYARFRGH